MVSKYELLRQPLTILVISNSQVFLVIVLVSLGSPHKVPQTWWFKTIEVYHLTFLKARSTKSSRTMLSLKLCRDPSLPLSISGGGCQPLVFLALKLHHNLCLCHHMSLSCLFPSSHNCVLSKIHVILS